MTDENLNGGPPLVDEVPQPSHIQVGLTPFGHLGINIVDSEGNETGHLISDPNEAWVLAGHIHSIATMMVQARYAMAMRDREIASKIMAEHGADKVWTPGDNNG